MSDSEDEFASADEGERESAIGQSAVSKGLTSVTSSASQSSGVKQADKKKETPEQKSSAAASVKKDIPHDAKTGSAAAKNITQKGKGKISIQKKKQGKQEAKVKMKPDVKNASGDTNNSGTPTIEQTRQIDAKTGSPEYFETLPDVAEESVNYPIVQDETTLSSPPEVQTSGIPAAEHPPSSLRWSGEAADQPSESGEQVRSGSPDKSYERTIPGQTGEATAVVTDQSMVRNGPSGVHSSVRDHTAASDDQRQEQTSGSGWGSWSSWGSSLVHVASASVNTFTSQVGEGLTTVLETVESTLGAPSPEELARTATDNQQSDDTEGEIQMDSLEMSPKEKVAKGSDQKKTEDVTETTAKDNGKDECVKTEQGGSGGGWFSSWGVSNLTSMVSDTGRTLVTGSLDVLETLGKKTYDVLTEHDPGLRSALKGENKPNLSSMLREAKEQATARSHLEEEFEESRQANFSAMFDEYQGLAHLEALEMLSNQSEHRVQALLSSTSADAMETVKARLIHIKEAFELEELDDDDEEADHDFSKLITEYLSEFHLSTSPNKLNAVQVKIRSLITDFYNKETEQEGIEQEAKEIHKVSIQSLAEMTSKSMEQFHKAGELLLLQKDRDADIHDRAKSLASLTRVLCTEVGILSVKLTKCLNKIAESMEESQSMNTYITNVYLEASNSSTYIQDAFQLLLPVLQQAAIQEVRGEDTRS